MQYPAHGGDSGERPLVGASNHELGLLGTGHWWRSVTAALPNYIPLHSGHWHLREKLRLCNIPEKFLPDFSPHKS
jgi:hypothetical protein